MQAIKIRIREENTVRRSRIEAATRRDEDPGAQFIDWVLGYGYAAGHWSPGNAAPAQGKEEVPCTTR